MRKVLNMLSPLIALLVSAVLFLFFITPSYATTDVALQWHANTQPDLAGYKVHYNTGSGEPYTPDVADYADQGSSPITLPIGDLGDPNNPEYTLTGLSDSEVYFFVVTAYDTEGHESDYSNEVNTPCIVTSITSTTADGYYKAGDTVNIAINFSKAVTLAGGNLIVTLDTGGTAVIGPFDFQTIASGTYTVEPGDNSGDLNATSLTLDPPTATLRNAWGSECDLSLPTGSNLADNNDIVIDTIPPNAPTLSGNTPTGGEGGCFVSILMQE